jgi:hypothetical protein
LQVITNHLHGLCDTIQKTLVADVDELFRSHELNQTILDAFNTIGEKQTQLLMNHVTRECFEKTSLYTIIFAHCTRLYGSITRGISEAMRKVSTAGGTASISTIMTMLMRLQPLLKAYGTFDEISKMRDSAATFLKNANKMIQDALNEHTSSKSSKNASVDPQRNVHVLRDQTMQQWKQTIVETSNQVIATHVIAPILSYGANQLVGFVGNSIKKQCRSFKEDNYRKEFESLKKDFDAKVKDDKLNAEEHRKEVKTYHEALVKLLARTKDAKLFANILRENVPMDMTCVQACTNVIDQCMRHLKTADGKTEFTGIRIVIEGNDGSSHEYSSSADPSHTISLTLDDNHFRATGHGNADASQNNCLYEALMSQVPELKTAFSDGIAFREHLSGYIENDESLQYTIAQGWHRFAIKKGSYGGAIKEENYDPGVLYNKHVENVQQSLKKFYRDNSLLSEDIRNEIQKCLDDIDNIATDDLRNDIAAEKINIVVKNFNKWLDGQLKKNESELGKELKQTISTFRERVIQTVRDNYQTTLEEFLAQARRADLSPMDPTAVHVADRVDFTKDDIQLERLVDQSTKPRNDPNIIASVIHAHLNKDLPEDHRRYNTVLVGIHNEAIYVAFNQVGIVNGQQTYGINEEQCEKICTLLADKKLLIGRYKVLFLEEKSAPRNQAACRAPHGEMQIMRFWKNAGILQEDNMIKKGKPWSIGGSKPACFCCSAAMKTRNVNHKVYGKANMSPKNWVPFSDINVKIKMTWNVQSGSRRQ